MPLLRTAPSPASPRLRLSDRAVRQAKLPVRWGVRHGLPSIAFGRGARAGDPSALLVTATSGTTPAELGPLLDELRSRGPVYRGKMRNVSVDHTVVKEVLGSSHFGSDFYDQLPGLLGALSVWSTADTLNPVVAPSLLAVDGATHARYRKLVTRVFSAKAVERLRGRTEQVAAELLDGIDPTRPFDLVERYSALLPVTVICEILGVPLRERDRVLEYGGGAAPSLDVGLSWRRFRSVETSLASFDAWLGDHLDHLRRHPGDNLLSQLVEARGDDGVGLTERELKATAGLVLAAGFETTVNLLSNGAQLLASHPDQLAALRERPELWPNAVDEVLRFDPPVLLTVRVAREDCEVAGQRFRAGAVVILVLAGANRDPQVFEGPGRFDVGRANARDHIAFSAGRHYCLGASLARMEGEVGLRTLFDRYPDLTLLPGATRRETRILRGFEHLPVRLG